jgi:predicted ATPase
MSITPDEDTEAGFEHPRILRLHLTNFLSYRRAILEFGDLVALVGPNASGKSNAVAAIKLLSEIPFQGLQTAIARRGGFDQLRHRSKGHPYNPALRLDFSFPDSEPSFYELKFGAQSGKRYQVSRERAVIHYHDGIYRFDNATGKFTWQDVNPRYQHTAESGIPESGFVVPQGQSAVTAAISYGTFLASQVLQSMQTVEINPTRVGALQEPSSTREFESDGSNVASIFEYLGLAERSELIDELAAIIPGIERIEVRRLADKVTLSFFQDTGTGIREFLAKQMSDGTLRAFGILLATLQERRPSLLIIEEPEIAIHLGALRTLVDILRQQSEYSQVLLTTHSADIIDSLDIDSLRVVWSDAGASHISHVASHSIESVRKGLITPGELLRSDSLDVATA